MATREDVRDKIAAAFIDALQGGIIPWRKPWRGGGMTPRNPVTGTIYKGGNALYLGFLQIANGYTSGEWYTFKGAQSKGANVRKGQKGSPIVFWSFIDKVNTKTGKKEKIPLVRSSVVFNRDQIEGLPEREASAVTAVSPIAMADSIVNGFSNAPELVHTEGDRACYYPSFDRVEMPAMASFTNAESYYHTLFHELAHSTGHDKRLKRPLSQMVEDYSKEELIAEITASFLSAEAGTLAAVQENSLAYVQGWAKRLGSEPRLILEAANAAQKAADLILGGSEAPEDKVEE